jgi:hypothetical protein
MNGCEEHYPVMAKISKHPMVQKSGITELQLPSHLAIEQH